MGDLESLLCALAVIYLLECIVWVQRGSVLFVRWWSRTCTVRHPGTLLGNSRGALDLTNPFPPFGTAFLGRPIPISCSAEAALAFTATCLNPGWRTPQTARLVRFAEMQSVEAIGKTVFVNGTAFVRVASPYAARKTAESLDRLRRVREPERHSAIEALIRDSLDTAAVSRRIEAYSHVSRWLRLLALGLFGYLFAIAPLVAWQFGLKNVVWPLVGGLVLQTITIAVMFRKAHQVLYPGGSEEAFAPFLTMLLAPPAAIRAADVLGRPLLESFHALAPACVLISKNELRLFARRVLLDLRYPILPACPTEELAAVSAEREFRTMFTRAVEDLLTRSGVDWKELDRAPKPTDPAHVAYCPRCHAQFVRLDGCCADCGGRALLAFPMTFPPEG